MSGLQKARAAQELPLLELRRDEHVLDVGCGVTGDPVGEETFRFYQTDFSLVPSDR